MPQTGGIDSRNRSRPPPLIRRFFPESCDLLAVAQHLETSRVLLYPVDSPVEVCNLAVGREDLLVQEVTHPARHHQSNNHHAKVKRLLNRAPRLLARRQIGPWHVAIVVEWRDRSPSVLGSGGGLMRRRKPPENEERPRDYG